MDSQDNVVRLVALMNEQPNPEHVTIMLASRDAAKLAWKLLALEARKKCARVRWRQSEVLFKNGSTVKIVCAKDHLLAGLEFNTVIVDELNG